MYRSLLGRRRTHGRNVFSRGLSGTGRHPAPPSSPAHRCETTAMSACRHSQTFTYISRYCTHRPCPCPLIGPRSDMPMTNGPRRAAAVLGGLALLAALQPPPAAAADPPAPAGGIAWAECPPELLDLIPGDDHLYDCATLDVPRDHADPGGPETAIDLVRRRA